MRLGKYGENGGRAGKRDREGRERKAASKVHQHKHIYSAAHSLKIHVYQKKYKKTLTMRTFVEVHMPVNIRKGSEILVAVCTAVDSTSVCQHCRFARIFPLHWLSHYIQPAGRVNREYCQNMDGLLNMSTLCSYYRDFRQNMYPAVSTDKELVDVSTF